MAMVRIAVFVVLALAARTALGQVAGPAPRVSAVAIMLESGQALLWDPELGEYLLVKSGERFQRFFVVTIERARVVLADADEPQRRYDLPLLPAPTAVAAARTQQRGPATITVAGAAPDGELPVIDPYTVPVTGDQLALVDPYSAPPGASSAQASRELVPTTVVLAPPGSRVASARPAAAPTPAATSAGSSAPVVALAPVEAVAAPPDAAGRQRVEVARSELEGALADFDRLSDELKVALDGSRGVKLLSVAPGSFVHRVGLRAGDQVIAIAGERITGIEAAARIYARVMAVDGFEIELDRSGKRVSLDVALR
jgi:hypothetical protein